MSYHLAVVGRECQDRAEGGSVPTYQYTCTECGEPLEAVQKFSDDPLTVCPACGGKLRKVFSAVGIVFKGSGFYRTDSRKVAEAGAAKANGSGAASADSGTGAAAGSSSGESSGKSGESSGKSGESSGKSGESSGKTGESSGKSGDSSGKSSAGEKKSGSAGASSAPSSGTKVA
jgi:putative FmdB family regulatory protein